MLRMLVASPPQPSPPAKSAGGEGVTSLRSNIVIYAAMSYLCNKFIIATAAKGV